MQTPLLAAWAAGPSAQRLAGLPKSALLTRALDSAWGHDRQNDPFARGAYSDVWVHGGQARHTLAEPRATTLFFAGEAADTHGGAGTVAGALPSGRRAAHAVPDAAQG